VDLLSKLLVHYLDLLVVHLTDELVGLHVYRIMLSAFHDDRLAVLRESGTLDLQFQALSIVFYA